MSKKIRIIPYQVAIFFTVAILLSFANILYAYHPPVQLLDKEGEFIDPINGENENAPFSTEQTCGLCHDYETMTKGFHFQTGWNVISDTYGDSLKTPWMLSNGMLGKWCVQSFRQLAKKDNSSADEIDLTVYDFIGGASYTPGSPTCGSCHAGSGGLEFDRDGQRYDETLADDPELRESLDGDYYQSNWDKSGVVEADCFICHFRDYNFEERINQLKKRNYQWAVVAASGIGVVENAVEDDEVPTVIYNRRFFNDDGTLVFDPKWPPPDDNCMFCHGLSDVKKRGFSWNDLHNQDIHQQQGMHCVSCHPAGEDHQLAKGNALQSSVADDLDDTMKGCEECHNQGFLGATKPKHKMIRPSHLERISCESCHIPQLHRAAITGIDATSGDLRYIFNPQNATELGELADWYPVYERRDDEVIYPFNNILTIWWSNLDVDSLYHPLFAREHTAAWELLQDDLQDDNGDGELEINRQVEIIAGLKAVRESLKDSERFQQINPAFVKGGITYLLDQNDELITLEREIKCDISYSINHNVTGHALGSDGCDDCHSHEANFFKGQRIVDLYGEDGQSETISIGRILGCNAISFTITTFHQTVLSPIVSLLIILVIFLVTVHYHSYGPKRVQYVPGSGEIERFKFFERGVHLARLLSFILLTVSGLIIAFHWHEWQDLFFRSPQQMYTIHIIAGFVFIITTILGIKLWFKDALFASYDKLWVKRIGGYLGYKGEVPSGRFNAGQKMFYWYSAIFGILISITGLMMVFKYSFPLSVICITSTFHNLFGFALIAGVFAHAYLGTVANPGTWRILVDGFVTREWAKHHHPNWYKKIMGEMETDQKEDDIAIKTDKSDKNDDSDKKME